MARRFISYLVTACTLLLAACAGELALPAVRPSPTPTTRPSPTPIERVIEECICHCAAVIVVDAWVDRDEDGRRGSEEEPLQDVTFRAEWHTLACETRGMSQKRVVSMVSDSTGHAETVISGCTCDNAEVYVETPRGYELTTPDHCRGGSSFGFAPRSDKTGAD